VIVPKISAWKCQHDGKIFEDHKDYLNHLRALARGRRCQRQLEQDSNQLDAVWNELYEREQSLAQWRDMLVEQQVLFWEEGIRNDHRTRELFARPHQQDLMPQLIQIKEFDLEWSDCVSNSHCAPVGGVENWGRKPDLPQGYPGWGGRITWQVTGPNTRATHMAMGLLFSGENSFRTGRQRVHTGTGGANTEVPASEVLTKTYSYDVKIFAQDWPGLARYREKALIWETLNNRPASYASLRTHQATATSQP
jgi:hypothetical protein